MPKAKGAKKTGGRKAGTPNKMTTTAKEAFQAAFDHIGGMHGLATWAKGNPGDFYKLYARLIPVDLEAKIRGKVTITFKEPLDGQ